MSGVSSLRRSESWKQEAPSGTNPLPQSSWVWILGAEAGTPQVQEVSEGKNSLTVLEWVPSLPFLVPSWLLLCCSHS